jgi:AraC-like DNA-binding protein
MKFKVYEPIDDLKPYIESIWKVDHLADTNTIRKIIPEGISEIIINLGDPYQLSEDGINYEFLDDNIFYSMRSSIIHLKQGRYSNAIGIRFKPFAFYYLTGRSLAAWDSNTISLENAMPNLNQSIYKLKRNNYILIEKLQSLLVTMFINNIERRNQTIEAVYLEIEQKKGVTSVGHLLKKFKVDYKNLERQFTKYIGVAPRLYIRYRRMHYALDEINRAKNKPDFMSIVVKYSFHDQSHLIREFVDLTGVSPLSLYEENNTLQKFYQKI